MKTRKAKFKNIEIQNKSELRIHVNKNNLININNKWRKKQNQPVR